MKNWNKLASLATAAKTREALRKNGIECLIVNNRIQAKEKALELLPADAEIMNMTSQTLEVISLVGEINGTGRFHSIRNKLTAMEKSGQEREMKRMGATPEWVIGSVHAVTETGEIFIASNTGSQLPAYVYGAGQVIWIIGTQKIVKNREAAFQRIYQHCLPLESERAKKAYGVQGSFVSKILIINREIQPGRIKIILVNEILGF